MKLRGQQDARVHDCEIPIKTCDHKRLTLLIASGCVWVSRQILEGMRTKRLLLFSLPPRHSVSIGGSRKSSENPFEGLAETK